MMLRLVDMNFKFKHPCERKAKNVIMLKND
jgi:hypothetical protein